MTLEEAIAHARQVAEGCSSENKDCAYQHDKLADWLEELQRYKNAVNDAGERVEVVRCRACMHGELDEAEGTDWYLCRHHGCDWNPGNHFCSYGERRDK